MEPIKASLNQIENTKTRKPIEEVRPPGGFLSSYVHYTSAPGSLGKTAVDVSSGETCWHRPLLQNVSCCCVGSSWSGFHAAETERPEMTTDPEMIRNLKIHHDPRDRSGESSSETSSKYRRQTAGSGKLELIVALRSVAKTRRPRLQVDPRSGRFTKVSGLEWLEKSVTL